MVDHYKCNSKLKKFWINVKRFRWVFIFFFAGLAYFIFKNYFKNYAALKSLINTLDGSSKQAGENLEKLKKEYEVIEKDEKKNIDRIKKLSNKQLDNKLKSRI